MSRRHAQTRCALRRTRFGGAFVSAAAAAAISLISAAPAHSSQKITSAPIRAVAVQAAAHPQEAQAGSQQASARAQPVTPASDVPFPGKGIASSQHLKTRADARWTPTATETLKLAISQVGVTEDANGGGTKFQKWFVSSPYAVRGVQRDGGSVGDYATANWCDMFVSWVGDQLGVKGMGVDAYTRTHAQWFKDNGRWGQTPTPGAVVFFAWSGSTAIDDIDHVGMVIKDNHDGTIQTVEGNTDNAVKIRTRDVSTVVGYGYPEYAPAAT